MKTQLLKYFCILVFISGCSEGSDMQFPNLDIMTPLMASRIDVFPEERVCEIDDIEDIKEFISELSNMYSTGWSRVHVSLAPKYRLSMGETEILILEQGIAILIPNHDGKSVTIGHKFMSGSGEDILNTICPTKTNL
jgi:hypothetical protein